MTGGLIVQRIHWPVAHQFVLVQRLLGAVHRLTTDVALVAAELVLALQVAPHVVSFVGDVATQVTRELSLASFDRIHPDQV